MSAFVRSRAQWVGAIAPEGVLTVGLLPKLEARIESPLLLLEPDGQRAVGGIGDSLIGVKYRLLDEAETLPAMPDTVVLRAGAVYAITDRIKLDGAVGVGVTRESPDVLITVGVTIALF